MHEWSDCVLVLNLETRFLDILSPGSFGVEMEKSRAKRQEVRASLEDAPPEAPARLHSEPGCFRVEAGSGVLALGPHVLQTAERPRPDRRSVKADDQTCQPQKVL